MRGTGSNARRLAAAERHTARRRAAASPRRAERAGVVQRREQLRVVRARLARARRMPRRRCGSVTGSRGAAYPLAARVEQRLLRDLAADPLRRRCRARPPCRARRARAAGTRTRPSARRCSRSRRVVTRPSDLAAHPHGLVPERHRARVLEHDAARAACAARARAPRQRVAADEASLSSFTAKPRPAS